MGSVGRVPGQPVQKAVLRTGERRWRRLLWRFLFCEAGTSVPVCGSQVPCCGSSWHVASQPDLVRPDRPSRSARWPCAGRSLHVAVGPGTPVAPSARNGVNFQLPLVVDLSPCPSYRNGLKRGKPPCGDDRQQQAASVRKPTFQVIGFFECERTERPVWWAGGFVLDSVSVGKGNAQGNIGMDPERSGEWVQGVLAQSGVLHMNDCSQI